MLLIDGVKYELWTPPNEDEFEQVVKEHAQEIFGQQSIYLDRKQKLKSLSGIGSIPDGYAIVFGNSPQWHIIEVELSSHPLHDHIVSQVGRFISGINNPRARTEIIGAIYGEINRDEFLKLRMKQVIGQTEIYKFLADLIAEQPILTIIIEKDTEGLREALNTLRYPQIKVVEFQTFVREGASAVHAHLFEPLHKYAIQPSIPIPPKISPVNTERDRNGVKRVTVENLIHARIIKVGQVIYNVHKGQRFEGKVLNDGSIELTHNSKKFDSLSRAARHITGTSMNGWVWWRTIQPNGTECLLEELRKEYEGK